MATEYYYKQWTADQVTDNVVHADDLLRWQAGLEAAGVTWAGNWKDGDVFTADDANALEAAIAEVNPSWTVRTWETEQVPGVDGFNRWEDGILACLPTACLVDVAEVDSAMIDVFDEYS